MLWVLIRSASAFSTNASNEYHNICFRGEIRKILCGYPLLSVAMGLASYHYLSGNIGFYSVVEPRALGKRDIQ